MWPANIFSLDLVLVPTRLFINGLDQCFQNGFLGILKFRESMLRVPRNADKTLDFFYVVVIFIDLLLQISDCSCRPLYQISNWCVHQNSLISHAEKVTHNDLYCFIDWLNQQWLLLFVYWPTSKKQKEREKNLRSTFHFSSTLPILPNQKEGWGSVKYFSLERGSKDEKVWKALI